MSIPRRILVVDDSPLVHELARIALEQVAGWQVLAAHTGAEAVEIAAREQPDALLLDVEMPGLDGPATLRALRERAATRELPAVFLTGHDDADGRARLAALGAAGVLGKPFEVSGLAGELAGLLGWAR